MPKAMLFIDGTWLYKNRRNLAVAFGKGPADQFDIDYGALPPLLARQIGVQMKLPEQEIDVVRTYLYGSIPKDVDSRDGGYVQRQQDFYDELKEEFHYEVELFEIDFRGYRYLARESSRGQIHSAGEVRGHCACDGHALLGSADASV